MGRVTSQVIEKKKLKRMLFGTIWVANGRVESIDLHLKYKKPEEAELSRWTRLSPSSVSSR